MASELLGMASTCLDYGMKVGIEANLDATTGIAIGSRRGLGKVKHINTVFLWVQDLVTKGKAATQQEAHQRNVGRPLNEADGQNNHSELSKRFRLGKPDR